MEIEEKQILFFSLALFDLYGEFNEWIVDTRQNIDVLKLIKNLKYLIVALAFILGAVLSFIQLKETKIVRNITVGSIICTNQENIVLTQHGEGIYSIGYALDKQLPKKESILARENLREAVNIENVERKNEFRSIIANESLVWLGIGGNITIEDDFWGYFHNCVNITDAQNLQKNLFFSGDIFEISKNLKNENCNFLRIVYGRYEWQPGQLQTLIENKSNLISFVDNINFNL